MGLKIKKQRVEFNCVPNKLEANSNIIESRFKISDLPYSDLYIAFFPCENCKEQPKILKLKDVGPNLFPLKE